MNGKILKLIPISYDPNADLRQYDRLLTYPYCGKEVEEQVIGYFISAKTVLLEESYSDSEIMVQITQCLQEKGLNIIRVPRASLVPLRQQTFLRDAVYRIMFPPWEFPNPVEVPPTLQEIFENADVAVLTYLAPIIGIRAQSLTAMLRPAPDAMEIPQ